MYHTILLNEVVTIFASYVIGPALRNCTATYSFRRLSRHFYAISFVPLLQTTFLCVYQVLNHLEGVRNPLPTSMHDFYVLIETTGSDETHDK